MDAKSDLEAKLRLRLIQKLGLKKNDSDASTKKDVVKNENCSNNQINKDDTVKDDHELHTSAISDRKDRIAEDIEDVSSKQEDCHENKDVTNDQKVTDNTYISDSCQHTDDVDVKSEELNNLNTDSIEDTERDEDEKTKEYDKIVDETASVVTDDKKVFAPELTESGYLKHPITDLLETGELVPGSGGRRDSTTVTSVTRDLTHDQTALVQSAKKYAMEMSMKILLMKQNLARQKQQTKFLQRQQAINMMSTLFIGGINYEVKEESIKQAFTPFGPITKIEPMDEIDPITGKHKGYTFVEFEQPEAAQLALEQMNGILLCGKQIRCGRPNHFTNAKSYIDEITREAKQFHRIYISSIHKDLSDDDVCSLFSAFGNIKFCDLAIYGMHGKHKGYGYIEYDNAKSAQDAISMNLYNLGGHHLRVGRALTPPQTRRNPLAGVTAEPRPMPSRSALAAASVTAKIQAMEAVASNVGVDASELSTVERKRRRSGSGDVRPVKREMLRGVRRGPGLGPGLQTPAVTTPAVDVQNNLEQKMMQEMDTESEQATLKQQENMSIKGKTARHMLTQKLRGSRTSAESRVLLLRNMVTHDEVDEVLQEEIEEECNKFGSVEHVIIYQEVQGEDESEVEVKIFVEFSQHQETRAAQSVMDGRFFGGRTVSATVYDQELFDQRDLSG